VVKEQVLSPSLDAGLLLTKSRENTHEGIKEVVKPFDWSFTTDYKGTITNGKSFDVLPPQIVEPIPIELLKRPDPILFFEEVVLYESELDDNGISMLSCKLRVMPDRMLVLCRMFMRLDDVIVRIRDTRIYVEFATGKIIRDYTEKEDAFEKVKKVSPLLVRSYEVNLTNFQSLLFSGKLPSDLTTALRDPNQIAHLIPEVKHTIENLTIP
jgi:type 2A phosphatase activator TIP41